MIVRESWEFGSELLAERHGIPILRVGLGLAGTEAETIELAAPAVDEARAQALPSNGARERLAATPYMTMMPAELEDPATPVPAQTRRLRFEVDPGAEELPDWWPGDEDPLVYLTFGSVAAGAHLPYYPALYRAAIDALAPLAIRILLTVGDAERDRGARGGGLERPRGDLGPARRRRATRRCDRLPRRLRARSARSPTGRRSSFSLFSNDQWANGEAVARAGAGITVADDASERKVLDLPGSTTIDELAGAVTSILEDATYRREAGRVAAAMRALASVDESVRFIEEIAGSS